MNQVLYRKYRPQTFEQVVGLENIKKVLEEQIDSDKVAHAYLFSGPRGTGKTTLARLFAMKVNAYKNSDDSSKSLDIVEIDAASNRGIDEIRELKKKINFVPVEGKYKVYIIDEVHMLTKEAFNALLKTLEEPPEHVIFIMATTEAHKIPMTILSRVMRFDIKLASEDQLKSKFKHILDSEKIKYDENILEVIIRQARGSYRDGESILEKIISGGKKKKIDRKYVDRVLGLADYELVEQFLEYINSNDANGALELILQIESAGINIQQFIHQLLEEVRGIMVSIVKGINQEWTLRMVGKLINELSIASNSFKTAVIPTLPLESAVLNLTSSTEEKYMGTSNETKVNKKSSSKKNIIEKSTKEDTTISGNTNIHTTCNITIKDVKDRWSELLNLIKGHNHHLTAFLIKSRPIKLEENILHIHVPFEFHRKKLEDKKSREIITSVMKELLNANLTYISKVDSALTEDVNKNVDSNEIQENNKEMVEEIFSGI